METERTEEGHTHKSKEAINTVGPTVESKKELARKGPDYHLEEFVFNPV